MHGKYLSEKCYVNHFPNKYLLEVYHYKPV